MPERRAYEAQHTWATDLRWFHTNKHENCAALICLRASRSRKRFILTTFKDLGLAEPILKTLSAEGYEKPTPIQADAIPLTIQNRDILGIAQTGTGKTAAFVLPQLHKMAIQRGKPAAKSAQVLIMTPTRELAAQIADSIKTYGRALKPSVAVVVGGVKPGPQIKTMARGVDFLVATPGRLLDHMQSGAINLSDVKTVVLDEADQMLDLGFLPPIRRIMRNVPDQRQVLLFSATMPKLIRGLADDFLDNPAEISVAPQSKPIERITQSVIFVEKPRKAQLLARLLKDPAVERAIVFTRTKHGANRLCQQLERAGINAQAIHGNKSQSQRQKTLDAFRKGSLNILIATDIAARGIDIDNVSHVFNYELPEVAEVYVHRIGRTARAGKNGTAVAFCDNNERSLLRDIEKLTRMKMPVAEIEGFLDLAPPAEAPTEPRKNNGHKRATGSEETRKLRRNRRRRRNKPVAAAAENGKPIAPNEGPARRRWKARGKTAAKGSADGAGLQRMLGNIGAGV